MSFVFSLFLSLAMSFAQHAGPQSISGGGPASISGGGPASISGGGPA